MYYCVTTMYNVSGAVLLSTSLSRRIGKKLLISQNIYGTRYDVIEYYFDTLDSAVEFLQGLWLAAEKQ